MPRPRKQTADYFPHYITSASRTIFILENTYGNDGYAFWFKLLEILGSTNGHYFNANDYTDLEFLSAKAKVSTEQALEILDKLASLNAIDRELWEEHKVIWCQNFVDNLDVLYTKRKVGAPEKPTFEEFPHRKPSVNGVSDTGNPQSKVKESKEKESKGEETVVGDNNLSKVLTSYENEIGMLSSTISDSFEYYLSEGIEADLIIKAIQIAVKNNARRLNYIEAILKNCIKDGTRTLRQHDAKELERESNKAPHKGKKPSTDDYAQALAEMKAEGIGGG